MITSKSLAASVSAVDPAWNVANAQFLGANQNFFYVGGQENTPQGLFFKPDGLKLYMVGQQNNRIYEYNLSTAWDVSTATFLQFFSVGLQATQATSLFFKPDGTKMYVLDDQSNDVNEYDLSTAWDISTAAYLQVFSVATQETIPTGLFFKTDGTKMYVCGTVSDNVHEYDLSTAWDILTAVFLQSFSVSAQESNPHALFFKPDGTKMYIVGSSGDDVNEYTLSTAWDISTASYLQNFSVAAQETTPTGLFFKDDGTVMYVIGSVKDTVFQYQLSTAWDISTATFSMPTTKYFSVAAQDTLPQDFFFKPDGTKMYVLGDTGNDVNEYNLSSPWAVSTATYLQNFSVSVQTTFTRGISFKSDGTKMYVLGDFDEKVNEYSLSVAWNISTAIYLQNFSVSAQEARPAGLFFKSDGTKMYVLGQGVVYEYDLSTAWDISTSLYLQLFSVSAQENAAAELFFKPDGTKMYVVGLSGDDVNEYSLSTPWNITTAAFVRLFSFVPQTLNPTGIFFRETGLQMYIISSDSDAVWEYDLV